MYLSIRTKTLYVIKDVVIVHRGLIDIDGRHRLSHDGVTLRC